MSTRNFKNNGIFNESQSSGEYSIPENFEIPPCSIEDVDRALFDLFDRQLPFTYRRKSGTKRAPVIFATGERFAVLRRKQPLRDKSGVLILPLISIMRTGITQNPTIGAGTAQNTPMVIKRRLTPEDQNYQRIINQSGLRNSDDHVVGFRPEVKVSKDGPFSTGSIPDPSRIMSVGASLAPSSANLNPTLNNNIFEIITMPPPKYYTATYEITFWTQYTTQMNSMIMSLMSMYQSYVQRTFKLETPKGYWFVAYAGESLNSDNNFDDFTDSERLVRYSFEITVPAYIVGNVIPGGQNVLRRTFSSPVLTFGIETVMKDIPNKAPAGIPSGDPMDYTKEDIRTTYEPLPGQSIAADSSANVDSRGPNKNKNSEVESVGGKDSKN